MTGRNRMLALAAALAVATAVAGTACGHPTSSAAVSVVDTSAAPTSSVPTTTRTGPKPTASGIPAGGITTPGDVDPDDPAAVAQAVAITIATVDTTTDTSPADAIRRAAVWIDPGLLTAMLTAPSQAGADWLHLVAHHGYTHVTAQIANEYGQPPNTDSAAYETISYTVQAAPRDHTEAGPPTVGVRRMRLSHTATGWKVIAFLP